MNNFLNIYWEMYYTKLLGGVRVVTGTPDSMMGLLTPTRNIVHNAHERASLEDGHYAPEERGEG